MSTIRAITILCDSCERGMLETKYEYIHQARSWAQARGWTHRGLGNDTCPDCTAKGPTDD